MTTESMLDDGRFFTEGQAGRLKVRKGSAAAGVAEFAVDLPYEDERDADPHFRSAALHFAADMSALMAVRSRLAGERVNGTSSMHANLLGAPLGAVEVHAEVVHWSADEALVEITAADSEGRVVLRGQSTFSLRPMASWRP